MEEVKILVGTKAKEGNAYTDKAFAKNEENTKGFISK